MFFFSKKSQPVEAEAPQPAVEPTAPAAEPEAEAKELPKPVILPKKTFKKEFRKMDYEVIISQNTAINGNISINGCTRIDGVIDGTLAVDNDLFIGESGNIRATVYAKNATISGQVTGNITCKEKLQLSSNARFTAISNARLSLLLREQSSAANAAALKAAMQLKQLRALKL